MTSKTKNQDLPPNMLRRVRGDWVGYYYAKCINGKRTEAPLGTNLDLALIEYQKIKDSSRVQSEKFWQDELGGLLTRTKKRAKMKGLDFSITKAVLLDMFESSGRACSLSGIPFSPTADSNVRFRPWMPSLDRIDPFGPYSPDNCRLVCGYINIAINQFGVDQLIAVSKKIASYKRKSAGGCGNSCGNYPAKSAQDPENITSRQINHRLSRPVHSTTLPRFQLNSASIVMRLLSAFASGLRQKQRLQIAQEIKAALGGHYALEVACN